MMVLAMASEGILASGGGDGAVRLWDVSQLSLSGLTPAPRVLQHPGQYTYISALAALEGGYLATGFGNAVYLWDVGSASDQPMAVLQGHTNEVLCLAALPRGLLASGGRDGAVRVWSVAARTCVAAVQGHSDPIWELAALPDGRLASGSIENPMGSNHRDTRALQVWEVHHL